MQRPVRTVDDVLGLLDQLLAADDERRQPGPAGESWWDWFYGDRDRGIPFFAAKPDENLVSYVERGIVAPGRAVDLGCGPGRNAIYLASRGFEVDAVDLSEVALSWAAERAAGAGAQVTFRAASIFAAGLPDGQFDLVYDSGCLHHLPPHRRPAYLDLVNRLLAPGGHYALTCFAVGQMGSELADLEFYRQRSLLGGLAFSEEDLRYLFSDLVEVELRPMRPEPEDSAVFGMPYLITALFRAPVHTPADPGER
ncbi:MAG TPA: class I SAM-dependent methyltransferase [Streptosporangiaceae bacterium]